MTRAEAYRRTLYQAGEVRVRIGRHSAAADRWMARHAVREAGFITGWNPMSRLMPSRWNAAAQMRLTRDLRGARFVTGVGALRGWREEMLLVALPLRELARLARRHRQAAIVLLRRGEPARLIPTAPAARRS
ncbi:DUF3293 domain-containing protein [Sediminicoccus sp. BL-A-41-H5]|uniref:DUF3293 domain-containing protein n=1 Tax=Sediminicoccus sp. BL-A-41-H5 TaxID=3421106 RepID=UPI003D670A15